MDLEFIAQADRLKSDLGAASVRKNLFPREGNNRRREVIEQRPKDFKPLVTGESGLASLNISPK